MDDETPEERLLMNNWTASLMNGLVMTMLNRLYFVQFRWTFLTWQLWHWHSTTICSFFSKVTNKLWQIVNKHDVVTFSNETTRHRRIQRLTLFIVKRSIEISEGSFRIYLTMSIEKKVNEDFQWRNTFSISSPWLFSLITYYTKRWKFVTCVSTTLP